MKAGKSILIRILGAAILCALPQFLFSQEPSTCAQNLKDAQAQFDKGHVEMIPGILKECMRSGFKREEQLAAYRLLIQSFIFEDKLDLADSTMQAFLNRFPEYQVSPTDHSSFVILFNSFKVKPILKVSVHLGSNLPYLSFVTQQTVSSEPVPGKYSTNMLNFYFSGEAKIAITPKLDVNAELGLSGLSFVGQEEFLHFGTIRYAESQLRIEIPVTVTYDLFHLGKLTPYVRAGLGAALDIKSTAKASFTPYDQSNSETHTGADIVRNDSRIFLDLFAQTGLGIKYKTPLGFISLEARLNNGFLNQVKHSGSGTLYNYEGTRIDLNKSTSAEELKYKYYNIDDAFNLNDLNICIGYTQIFYRPSKRK
jgi:hypothetical protein